MCNLDIYLHFSDLVLQVSDDQLESTPKFNGWLHSCSCWQIKLKIFHLKKLDYIFIL